jgi:hypothetical protein
VVKEIGGMIIFFAAFGMMEVIPVDAKRITESRKMQMSTVRFMSQANLFPDQKDIVLDEEFVRQFIPFFYDYIDEGNDLLLLPFDPDMTFARVMDLITYADGCFPDNIDKIDMVQIVGLCELYDIDYLRGDVMEVAGAMLREDSELAWEFLCSDRFLDDGLHSRAREVYGDLVDEGLQRVHDAWRRLTLPYVWQLVKGASVEESEKISLQMTQLLLLK